MKKLILMRKIIYGINITLDGCCDHTKGIGDKETHEYFTDLLRQVDLLVYGRKTYELMVPFWPMWQENSLWTMHRTNLPGYLQPSTKWFSLIP